MGSAVIEALHLIVTPAGSDQNCGSTSGLQLRLQRTGTG